MNDDKLAEIVAWAEANYPVPVAAQGAQAQLADLRQRAEAPITMHPQLKPPSEAFVAELAARLNNPDLIATARDLLHHAHVEMHATKGSEHGLIAVFAHVLGHLGAIYAVEKGEDIVPVLAAIVHGSRNGLLPGYLERRAEIAKARGPKIIL